MGSRREIEDGNRLIRCRFVAVETEKDFGERNWWGIGEVDGSFEDFWRRNWRGKGWGECQSSSVNFGGNKCCCKAFAPPLNSCKASILLRKLSPTTKNTVELPQSSLALTTQIQLSATSNTNSSLSISFSSLKSSHPSSIVVNISCLPPRNPQSSLKLSFPSKQLTALSISIGNSNNLDSFATRSFCLPPFTFCLSFRWSLHQRISSQWSWGAVFCCSDSICGIGRCWNMVELPEVETSIHKAESEETEEEENEKNIERTSARLTNRDDPLKHRRFPITRRRNAPRVVSRNLCVNLASKSAENLNGMVWMALGRVRN
jgi:hypothetical protein